MRNFAPSSSRRTGVAAAVPVAVVYIADVAGEAQLSDTSPGDYFLAPDGGGTLRINDSASGAAMLVLSGGEVKVLA